MIDWEEGGGREREKERETDLWSSYYKASRRLEVVDCLVIKILSRDHFLRVGD